MNDHDEAHLYDGAYLTPERIDMRMRYPRSRRDDIMDRIAALRAELKALDERPIEPSEDATVISLDKQFTGGERKYHYAFVKAAGKWWGTGPKAPKGFTWDELMDWLEDSGPMPIIYLMEPTQTLNIVRGDNG